MTVPLDVDHFIYATPDADGTAADLGARLGVELRRGGSHPGWGTRNHVLPLGDDLYLEVIGPDEEQADTPGGRILGIDALEGPRMVWWAVRPFLMPLTCGEFETAGFIPGEVITGRRDRPDGSRLEWQLTDPRVVLAGGILPMVIDWEGGEHPGASTTGARLKGFELRHPEHRELTLKFADLGLPSVEPGDAPEIVVHLEGPGGTVTLR